MIQQKKLVNFSITFFLLVLPFLHTQAQISTIYVSEQWQQGSRYQPHGDGTVTDIVTGLMWKKCSEGLSGEDCATGTIGEYTWKDAMEQAKSANDNRFAGYSDWRVPNIKELYSLIAFNKACPAINLTLFPRTSDGWYWTSTPAPRPSFDDHRSLAVDFHSMVMDGTLRNDSQYFNRRPHKHHFSCSNNRDNNIRVRLVRTVNRP